MRRGAHEDFTFEVLHVQFESFRVGFQCDLVLWLKPDAVNVEQIPNMTQKTNFFVSIGPYLSQKVTGPPV